jgi:fatty acid desaturase
MKLDETPHALGRPGEEFFARPRVTLPPDVLRRLSTLSPARATLSFVADWATVAACVATMTLLKNPIVWIAGIFAIAAAQHGLAILAHQAAHYRMYRSRRLNDLVGVICATPLGVSMHTYRIIHRIHHNHLYEPTDPDLALMAGYPRGRWYLIKKFAKDLCGVTSIKNYLYFFGKPLRRSAPHAESKSKDDTSEELRRLARIDRRATLAFHAVMIGASVAFGFWREYFLCWLLPLVTALQFLLRLRALCEHGAVTDTSTPLRAARTNLAPAPVRWFLFPHQMHYHIEHHLYPAVPHYRLAECHRELKVRNILADAEISSSFRETFAKFFAPPLTAERR